MNKSQTNTNLWNSRVKKNTLRLYFWAWAWVLSVAVLGLGPQLIWDFNFLATITAGLINISIGIGLIIAIVRYIKGQDEMQQKICLEASAITLGATMVFAGSYQLWGDIKLLPFEPQVWILMMVMGLTFSLGTALVSRKYQ